ncbi:MAG: FHA domain-containing protein [Chloroflexi bacterium]|nr:FHA domain-containing protein [Chloroflexota bacterium]
MPNRPMADLEQTPMARLVALSDDVSPAELLLSGAEHTLGRAPGCDIVVRRQTVSRLHARIVREGPRYVLRDAGSANGTFVNGQSISGPHLLADADAIGLGAAGGLLRFLDPDPTVVSSARLRFDERSQRFLLNGQQLDLPPGQFKLLLHLYRHLGELCSREVCAQAIWGRDYDPGLDAEALDRVVSNLRAALRRAEPGADLIQTRRGLGYVLFEQPPTAP